MMVNLYVRLIMEGKWALERVPLRWRDEVAAELDRRKKEHDG